MKARRISLSAVNQHPSPFMEHRWGERLPCRASVRFCTADGVTGGGRVRDVSSSGAFIETATELPLFAQLELLVLGNESAVRAVAITASVVRIAKDGVGVEWCETPAGSICSILGCSAHCVAPADPPCQLEGSAVTELRNRRRGP
jgi:hypothetical protein